MGAICGRCCEEPVFPREPLEIVPVPVRARELLWSEPSRDLVPHPKYGLEAPVGAVGAARDKLKFIVGQVKTQWAAVDDRRLWIAACLPVDMYTHNATYLVVEFVGCLCCDDPKHHEYRTRLMRRNWWSGGPCHEFRAFMMQVYVARHGEAALSATDQVWFTSGNRTFCRYCGLTYYHHLHNRELTDDMWSTAEDYCLIRCPIHLCIACGTAFVKVAATHLCASCLVKSRQLRRTLWRLWPRGSLDENQNNYTDEITAHVPVAHKLVARSRHGPNKSRSGHYTVIDEPVMRVRVQEFLNRTETVCGICDLRFRLPIVRPACFAPQKPICGFCVPTSDL